MNGHIRPVIAGLVHGINAPPNAVPRPIACVEAWAACEAAFAHRPMQRVRYVISKPKRPLPQGRFRGIFMTKGADTRLARSFTHDHQTGVPWQRRISSILASSPAATGAQKSRIYGVMEQVFLSDAPRVRYTTLGEAGAYSTTRAHSHPYPSRRHMARGRGRWRMLRVNFQ
jgi:hypothetical protein